MKKYINLTIFILILLLPRFIFGHPVLCLQKEESRKTDTLIDKSNGNRFFADQEKECVVVINEKGIVLWTTHSINDKTEEIIFGKCKSLKIISLRFEPDINEKQKELLRITYSDNSNYYLDKISGKITLSWHD